jgi:hypothetical protein
MRLILKELKGLRGPDLIISHSAGNQRSVFADIALIAGAYVIVVTPYRGDAFPHVCRILIMRAGLLAGLKSDFPNPNAISSFPPPLSG